MKIAIVGTGAMGSVYAALFASAGHEVWAIDRWKEHIEAMRSRGLRVEGASGERTVRLNATTDPREAGPCDLVVLATKAMHVAAAAASL
ncbi:MAG: ketopantoate reductase family protein, partial [Xanthobacteraceae bacterium]